MQKLLIKLERDTDLAVDIKLNILRKWLKDIDDATFSGIVDSERLREIVNNRALDKAIAVI